MRISKLSVCACVLILVACASVRFLEYRSENLIFTFWDVGQGDSIFVQFPTHETMLVDAPSGHGKWNTGEKVVLMELLRKGTLSLDYLVLSHPDSDHSGGLAPILNALKVRRFVTNEAFRDEVRTKSLAAAVVKRGGEAIYVKGRDSSRIGDVNLTWISPEGSRLKKTNDRSLLVVLQFGVCDILLTGDIEKKTEKILSRQLPQIDLLKVAHHGSQTSSTDEFLDGIDPILAVVSLGWRNPYHHPHPSVTARFQRRRVPLFRTDVDGFIQMTIDAQGRIACHSWHGECGNYACKESVPGSSSKSFLSDWSRSRNSAARSN